MVIFEKHKFGGLQISLFCGLLLSQFVCLTFIMIVNLRDFSFMDIKLPMITAKLRSLESNCV